MKKTKKIKSEIQKEGEKIILLIFPAIILIIIGLFWLWLRLHT